MVHFVSSIWEFLVETKQAIVRGGFLPTAFLGKERETDFDFN